MSENIKHECGVAFIRLLKPLEYYYEKYGSNLYGLNRLYLLMEKQHNRGQDGAGVASVKLSMPPGSNYIDRVRSKEDSPIKDVFDHINGGLGALFKKHPSAIKDGEWLKHNANFTGEILLGHLRYGTFGKNTINHCHPFHRQSNWKTRNLILAGNFNLTNVEELFQNLVNFGQSPNQLTDSVTMLEKIGHFLDEENNKLLQQFRAEGMQEREAYERIQREIDLFEVLRNACKKWDGGYVIAGLLGHGDSFIHRDPSGIRPVYYYSDDEIFVATSERPPIQTAFNVPIEKIKEITPGEAIVIKANGTISNQVIREALPRKSCSFERIYFSRGSDKDIYRERKLLGKQLVPQVLKAIGNDLDNTVFSYIPNTAETAFLGLVEGIQDELDNQKLRAIKELGSIEDDSALTKILSRKVRAEKIAIKDAKLRTFITEDSSRNDLVAHVYDTTYGVIRPGIDNLVVLDDSIVRGTTLKQSIIRILDRLRPKKIVVVSSAPQIRFPDCYGIDMAKMAEFIAFEAGIELLKQRSEETKIGKIYERAKELLASDEILTDNPVRQLFSNVAPEDISAKITEMLKPVDLKAELEVIYQSLEGLHNACPNHEGDWYFSGNYPTSGGHRVVCQSFVNFIEGINKRAY